MWSQNISFGGLRLEANLDLRAGESLDFDIVTNDTRIRCKGKILAVEDLQDKVQARLYFTPASDWESRKLSDYLNTLSQEKKIHYINVIIIGLLIVLAYIAYLIIRNYLFR